MINSGHFETTEAINFKFCLNHWNNSKKKSLQFHWAFSKTVGIMAISKHIRNEGSTKNE